MKKLKKYLNQPCGLYLPRWWYLALVTLVATTMIRGWINEARVEDLEEEFRMQHKINQDNINLWKTQDKINDSFIKYMNDTDKAGIKLDQRLSNLEEKEL